MYVKYFLILLLFIFPLSINAANSENEIKAAVLGKLSHFVKHKSQINNDEFIITVFQDETFAKLLKEKYNNKQINHKNVLVKNVQAMEEINSSDLLYIGKVPQEIQYQLIEYAQSNNLLTISEESGFAQRGGIVQLYFVSLKIRFKINLNAAKKSNLKISSSLLSISTIVKGETK
jgi:hypothetical protein